MVEFTHLLLYGLRFLRLVYKFLSRTEVTKTRPGIASEICTWIFHSRRLILRELFWTNDLIIDCACGVKPP